MIKQGQATIDELGSTLRALGPVDVRLLVRRTPEGLSMVTVVAKAGDDLSGLEERTHDYGDVLFIKAAIDGDELAGWLTRRSGEVHGLTFSLPEPSPSCSWFHSESFTHARYGTLSTTPHTDYEVIPQSRIEPPMPGTVLAGAGLPFFPDVNVAAASVLFGEHSMPAGRTIPSELMLVRIAHPGAYLGTVAVSPTALVVPVLGGDLDGVQLQVSSAGEGHEERVVEPGDVRVPVSGADRSDTWVALTRGQECLDFRAISSSWPLSFQQGGVVYEPDDLDERLDRMRLGGESETVEFKEAIPDSDRIARAVAAFSNGSGGTIIIGIDDTGGVVGIAGDAGKARHRLDNIVRSKVSPPPEYELSTHTLERRTVIAMRVAPGDRRPYGVSTAGGILPYVRRGANNWAASSDEIRVIAWPRQPSDEAASGQRE